MRPVLHRAPPLAFERWHYPSQRAILLKTNITPPSIRNKNLPDIPRLEAYDLPSLSIAALESLWDKISRERADLMLAMGTARTNYAETGAKNMGWFNSAGYAKHRRKLLLRAIERTIKQKRAEALGEEFWNQVFFEVAKTKIPPEKFKLICQQADAVIKHISETGVLP